MSISIYLSICLSMDIWVISNLFGILNNVAVENLKHISWCLGWRISVEYKPSRGIPGSKDMCVFHFTKDSPKWMGKYTHLAMYETLCSIFLARFVIISLLIFISLINMKHLNMLTSIFLMTKLTCLFISQVSSVNYFFILAHVPI